MSKVIRTALIVGGLYVSHKAAFKAGQALAARSLVLTELRKPGTFDQIVNEYTVFKGSEEEKVG